MKVESLGRNKTLIKLENKAVLISYSTLVACLINDNGTWKAYKTSKYHSVTTSRHINDWFKQWSDVAEQKDQSWFDKLLDT